MIDVGKASTATAMKRNSYTSGNTTQSLVAASGSAVLSRRVCPQIRDHVIIVGRRKRLFDDYPTLAISTTMLVGSLVGHVGFGCGVSPGKDFGSFES
jgi:hypothetical protein